MLERTDTLALTVLQDTAVNFAPFSSLRQLMSHIAAREMFLRGAYIIIDRSYMRLMQSNSSKLISAILAWAMKGSLPTFAEVVALRGNSFSRAACIATQSNLVAQIKRLQNGFPALKSPLCSTKNACPNRPPNLAKQCPFMCVLANTISS